MLNRLVDFAKLQFSAAIFGIGILVLIMVSSLLWQDGWPIYRYDFLFIAILLMQIGLLATGRETWAEARIIFVFHIVAVVMEIFKTSVGSWIYPGPSLFAFPALEFQMTSLFGVSLDKPLDFVSSPVPLFTGFMYSAVGSYIARGWRLSGMRLTGAPVQWAGGLLALAIYINFYTHHLWHDARHVLMVAALLLYWKCWAEFPTYGKVPLLALFIFVGLLVYAAENIGSLSGTWLYPNQHEGWQPVPIGKLSSWTLLMIVSFSLVRLVKRD